MNRQEAYLDALAAMRTALHHAPKVGPATRVPLCHYNDKPGTSDSAVVFSVVPQVMYRAERIYATGWTPTHLRIEGRAVELAPEEGAPRACFVPKVPEIILPGLLLEVVGERKEGARNTPKVLASGTILGDDGKPHATHLGLLLCNELREFEVAAVRPHADGFSGEEIELRLTQGGQALRLFVIVEGGSAEDLYIDDLKIGRDSQLAGASIPVVLVPHGVFLPEVFVYPGLRLMVWLRNRGAEPARVRFELGMRPILEDSPLDGVNTAPPEGAPLE